MWFSVVFVSLLFVGSSVAQSNALRMASLKQLHSHINTYVTIISQIYNGFEQLKLNQAYLNYQAYYETLTWAVTTLAHNEQLPEFADIVQAPNPDNVIEEWKNRAIAVIDVCLGSVGMILEIQGDARSRLLDQTKQTMEDINNDPNIIPGQKKSGCPMYETLSGVMFSYGGMREYRAFQKNYGTQGQ